MDQLTRTRIARLVFAGHPHDRITHYTGVPAAVVRQVAANIHPNHTAPPQVLILPRGVMGCGKSTWIEQVTAGDVTLPHLDRTPVVTSRDEWREILGLPPIGDADQEGQVTERIHLDVRASMRGGDPLIIDAMHLRDSQVRQWDAPGRLVIVADFRMVPLDVCIARMQARKAAGGRGVDARTPERDVEILTERWSAHVEGRVGIPRAAGAPPVLYAWGFPAPS